jgi:hypothetical protein
MRAHGLAYLRLWVQDFGWTAGVFGLGLVAPAPRALPGEPEEAQRARHACLWLLRSQVAAVVAFILWSGGDFFGGYRFLAPALPLASILVVAAAVQWTMVLVARSSPGRATAVRGAALMAGALLLAGYASRQLGLRAVFEEGSKLVDPPLDLEEIKWTRFYARRWVALGRWIAERARPGDWMADGAAGATPYYAGINNVDLYGLCDAEVARHGTTLGNKPGHQRWASKEYAALRRPAFLFYSGARMSDEPGELGHDGWWEGQGYISVRARIDARYGAEPYYIYFQMPRERARALKNDPSLWFGDEAP